MPVTSILPHIPLPIIASVALAACAPTGPNVMEQVELAGAMQRWAARGYPAYQVEVHWECGECLESWSHLLRLTVRNGAVTEVFDVTAGTPIDKDSRALTVEEMFVYVQAAIDRRAYRLAAQYDPTLGYPTSVGIDWSQTAVDDEGGFGVASLAPLP